ncbi:MAG: methylisocitrate lyase [SAR202 cluster bacterium]|jgi:methylisocitrate lyase|nr:methylisocitrate lyase [SAR202 cluster bacterium]MDP6511716.1 methylisocitrate lyase [SAR202 cluster bacterium]MDP6714993.1 methylisocitrate lyase [SAR202 cluster bacterium]
MHWLLDDAQQNYPQQLKDLIDRDGPLSVPGAYNPMASIMARNVGFEALYFSGAAFSAGLGIPDIGLFTLDQLTQAVRDVVRASGLPLIVDADTGFGEPVNVFKTVRDLEDAGAAAIQIEDQVMPKRCGHLDGKTVVPAEEFVQKLRAASHARREALIVARTDSKAIYGMDEAIRRGRMYRAAGADIIFPEALETPEEFRAYADAVDGPLLANMTEFGKTPYLSADEFCALGYKIVIFPVTAMRVAAKATEMAFQELHATGTQTGLLDKMQTRAELYQLIEYDRYTETDASFANE